MTIYHKKVYINGVGWPEHVVLVEKLLGRSLPKGAEVHHIDAIRNNNINSNLVVCPDRAYHNLIHQRQRAMEACGNPNWRKCYICKQYSPPEQIKDKMHIPCRQERQKELYYRNEAKKRKL